MLDATPVVCIFLLNNTKYKLTTNKQKIKITKNIIIIKFKFIKSVTKKGFEPLTFGL